MNLRFEKAPNNIYLENIYKIPNQKVVNTPIWNGDGKSFYFQTEMDISKYTLERREVEIIYEDASDFIFDVVDSEIIICSWENYLINDPSEIATNLWVEDLKGHIFNEFETNRTVKPVTCGKDLLFATDNYPNSLERHYSVNLEDGLIKEIKSEIDITKFSTKDNLTIFTINGINFELEFPNIFIEAKEKNQKIALVDRDDNLWIAY